MFACRSGKRSVTASLAAQAAGLPYDKHLAGGMLGWKAAGFRPRAAAEAPGSFEKMTSMNKVFADLPVTVFEAMSQLARDNNAINLGQGFPDDPGPEDIRRAAADAALNGYNQYPSMMGMPELRQAIAVPLRALARPQARSDDRGDGDLGGTEALTSPSSPWSSPATRSSASSRSMTPICRSSARPAAFRGWCGSSRRIGG